VVGLCSVSISGLQATAVANPMFTVSAANQGILNFSSVVAPLNTDEVRVTFPSEYNLGNVETIVLLINGLPPARTPDTSKLTNLNQLLIRPFIDNSLSFYEITISNLTLTYPVVAGPLTIDLLRYGYPYSSVSCCSNTRLPAQTLTLAPSLTTATVRSQADYTFSLSLAYSFASYLLLTFCSGFTLSASQQYPCYVSL
jgi:hypothetical protein